MATQEYDINDLLKNIKSPTATAGSAKEYDINSLLTDLQPYKEQSLTAGAGPRPSNILKGAEFFARNPIGSQVVNTPFVKDVAKGVASVLDTTVGSVIPGTVGYVTQAVVRPFTTPERSAEIAQNISGAIDKPFGKVFGITEDPAYKNEATNRLMQYIGENMDKGADWLSKQTGLPKEDVANMMNSVGLVGGYQVGKVTIPTSIKNTAEKLITGKEKPTVYQEPTGVIADLNRQFEEAKANLSREPAPTVAVGGAPGTAPITPKAVEVLDPATGKPVVMAQEAPALNPALAQKVSQVEQAGGTVNPDAVARQNKALSVDPRLQLTEGQALQDANLISMERNDRGIKEQLVSKFNEQNQILKERAEIYKNEFTPDVKGLSYVENATNAINAVDDLIKKNENAAKAKYEDLKKLGGGKLELDGKSFGTTARQALGAEDIQDFVPSQIMKRIDDYADGKKQMNLNLFEGLRTQIARESRKAERAGDGNTVYALKVVRNELEQMPLANEAGAIKSVADEARALFKSNRDLEANNAFYGQASRGGLDSKDFVPKVAFRSKNDYFGQAMEVLNRDPVAKQNFAQGTMDYMIRESTDGSGNLNPMKMANFIEDLQLNGRLEPLFGKENSAKLLNYAEVSRFTKSTPEGSFVNFSNTAPAAANLISRYGSAAAEVAGASLNIPFVGEAVRTGSQFMEKRRTRKQAEKATEFGAGVEQNKKGNKISDILKE
jgi:hypothetical protein